MRNNKKRENEQIPVDEALEAGFEFEGYDWGDGAETDSEEKAEKEPITQLTDEQENEVKNMPRQRLEEILSDLEQHKFEINQKLYSKIRKSIINALRSFVHEDLGIIELESKRDPNQPTLRYETDAEVFELFPEPEPKPEPKKRPADIIRLSEQRLPEQEIVRYDEVAKMYEFPGLS